MILNESYLSQYLCSCKTHLQMAVSASQSIKYSRFDYTMLYHQSCQMQKLAGVWHFATCLLGPGVSQQQIQDFPCVFLQNHVIDEGVFAGAPLGGNYSGSPVSCIIFYVRLQWVGVQIHRLCLLLSQLFIVTLKEDATEGI